MSKVETIFKIKKEKEGQRMSDLKPCPFCGGAVNVYYVSIFRAFVFTHKDTFTNCMFPELVAYFDDYDISSLEHAAAAWNRRANNE